MSSDVKIDPFFPIDFHPHFMKITQDKLTSLIAYHSCCVFCVAEAQFIPNKQLQPKETQIYIKLVKYAMQALDIYQV